MPFMEWNSSFELGIHEFDEHHKHLVYLLNLTHDAITCGAEHDELGAVIDELVEYAAYHFSAEEGWMADNRYPGLPEHIGEHTRFTRWIIKVHDDFHNGKAWVAQEVLTFLNRWLTDHILRTDAKYGRFTNDVVLVMCDMAADTTFVA